MTPQPQQQYLLITEEELLDLLSFADAHDYQWTKQTEQTIRSRPAPSPTTYDHDVIGDILRSHSSPASIVQYESWISGMKYTDIKAAGTVAAIWIGDMRYLLDEEAERKRNQSLRTGGDER